MVTRVVKALAGAAALFAWTDAIHAAPPLAPGCYVIVDPKDQPNLDNAQEVVCVNAAGHAVVRESSLFGEGIKGCNVVTLSTQQNALIVDIDYKKCTNNSPSHQLVCRADGTSGAYACISKMGSRKEDEVEVKLAPLPPG